MSYSLKTGKPCIQEKEVIEEISNRTGLPNNSIYSVLHTLYDIVMESIEAGVEVRLHTIGFFTWKVMKPKKNFVFRNSFVGGNLPPMDVPGYRIPQFKCGGGWRRALRAATEYWEEETNENNKENERENSD